MRSPVLPVLGLLTAVAIGVFGISVAGSANATTLTSRFQPRVQKGKIHGTLPFPNDLLFWGSKDGTVNAPLSASGGPRLIKAVDSLDGFSTVASAYVDFSAPLKKNQNFAAHVQVFRLDGSGTHIASRLSAGTVSVGRGRYYASGDYTLQLEPDSRDKPGRRLLVRPLKPLTPSTHYLVVVESGLIGAQGRRAGPSPDFAAVRSKTPVESSTAPEVRSRSRRNKKLLKHVQATYRPLFDQLSKNWNIKRENIINAWTFTTQSIGSSLEALRKQANANASPGKIALADLGVTTKAFGGAGRAEVFIGTVTLPYHLGVPTGKQPKAPLKDSWLTDTSQKPTDAGSATGAGCSSLKSVPASPTRCYPFPKQTAWMTVPVLATVPLDGSGHIEQGDSAVIVQHGYLRNRSVLLSIARTLSKRHLVGIAIDHPLHGITPTSPPGSPVLKTAVIRKLEDDHLGGYLPEYQATEAITAPHVTPPVHGQGCVALSGAVPYQCFGERTFDLDANGNGKIDSSGASYMNLAAPRVMRDNFRESVVGLMNLYATLKHSDHIPVVSTPLSAPLAHGGSLRINNADVGFMGHSLGAIAGTTYTAVEAKASFPSVLANPGGGLGWMMLGSPALSGMARSYMTSVGIHKGTRAYQQFARLNQTIWDSGDPVNYAAALNPNYRGPLPLSSHPIDMIEVIGNGRGNPPDQWVPNNVVGPMYFDTGSVTLPAPLSGTAPLVARIGLVPVQVTPPVQRAHGVPGFTVTQFTEGQHSSVHEPEDSVTGASKPNTRFRPVTEEMLCELGGFLASGGSGIHVGCQ